MARTEPLAALAMAERLLASKTDLGAELARSLATETLAVTRDRTRFLPLLDAFLEAGIVPSDTKRLVRAAQQVGLDEDLIYERLSLPLEQLKHLIHNNLAELARYLQLAVKVEAIPDEVMETLVQQCVRCDNLMGMATLLAVSLGGASCHAPAAFVTQSFGYKGIGGGTNLLKQWFSHRDDVSVELRARVKEIAKSALLNLSLDLASRGTGGAERGLVPQAQARPLRTGDDFDLLDLETTLESLISSGKGPDQLSADDLFVQETSRGRAAFGVLIDISGSMSGKELAICAISVVMLLGRLKSEEIAIAVFESDTHVIKGFADSRDLDEVADDLLELRATGGTRVDQALRWIADEFAGAPEHEFRLLFLLSDFCFCESVDEIRPLAERLAELGVKYLGASHGHVCPGSNEALVGALGGGMVKLPSVSKVPDVLAQALAQLGESGC